MGGLGQAEGSGKERSRPIWPVFRRWDPKDLAVEGGGRSRISLGLGAQAPGSLLVAEAELRMFLRKERVLGGGFALRQAPRTTWTCGSCCGEGGLGTLGSGRHLDVP